MLRSRIPSGLLGLLAAGWFTPAALLAQTNFINFEGKQTRPICLSPNGTRLFAVNTPDSRLSVFDVSNPSNPVLISEISVGLEPVSVNARTDDEVWVVNEVSDSVSVVSVSRALVTDTLQVKDEPADVVFVGGRAFISAARNNRIAVFDATSHVLLTNLAVFGENPRALAVGSAGTNVFAAFALSGNRTTLVPDDSAPPQSTNDMRVGLPPPPQVGLIVDATDPLWTNGPTAPIKFTMPDNDVVEIDVSSLTVTRYYSRVGTVNLGLAVRPTNGDLFVANADAGNLTQFEPGVRGHFYTNRLTRIAVAAGTITYTNLDPALGPSFPDLTAKSNALAQPTALVFDPGGGHLWLAAFGTDRIAKIDPNGTVLARIDVGPASAVGANADPRNKRGPRGLALHAAAGRLYVLNRLANTLTVIDTVANSVVRELPVGSYDPTPSAIRQGRGFLYDAKLSGGGTVSCASCHIDAEMDLIGWDLGDPGGQLQTNHVVIVQLNLTNTSVSHPMKGPMTTQTLRGLNTLDPLHWRGDRASFLNFNGAFDSLLGGAQLTGADMAVYRDFINTVVFQPNPNQNLDRSLPASFAGGNPIAGRTTYTNEPYAAGLTCNTCHTLPEGTARVIIPALALQESQDFKVSHLRNIYQKTSLNRTPGAQSVGGFGFLHDGTFPTIFDFLSQPVFQSFATDTVRKQNLNAFLQCLDTGTAPAAGYTRTLISNTVALPAIGADWTTLEAQAALSNINLIAKGTLNGGSIGLLYQPAAANYVTDRTGLGPFTRAQLQTLILAGDILSVMGVPPGSGMRMGIDRNSNGILDGDEPPPALRIAPATDNALLAWPTNDYGFVLEFSDSLIPALWSTMLNERGVTGSDVIVTNALTNSFRFFRLRRPW